MGQPIVDNSSGSTSGEVKHLVNITSLVGGGLEETNFLACGPLRRLENHHQVVVVVMSAGAAGDTPPLQLCLGESGAQCKIHKNERKLGKQI